MDCTKTDGHAVGQCANRACPQTAFKVWLDYYFATGVMVDELWNEYIAAEDAVSESELAILWGYG